MRRRWISPQRSFMHLWMARWNNRLNAYARVQRFALGEPHTAAELTLLQRYAIGPQTALRLELARKMEFDMIWSDVRVSLQQYF